MPTPAEIEETMAEDAELGISSVTSDGQTTTAMSADDRMKLADRAAAQAVTTGGDAWGTIGRRRAMPNWNE